MIVATRTIRKRRKQQDADKYFDKDREKDEKEDKDEDV